MLATNLDSASTPGRKGFKIMSRAILGVLQALVAAGITVPDEIAVVGFDDTEFAAASVIPLTSVSTRHAGFGEAVVDVLFDTISGRQPAEPHRVFAPELIVRASTGGGGVA